jgi:hypothetical protein
MREQRQKIYILLTLGVTLFITTLSTLLIVMFNSSAETKYDIEQVEIANVTTNTAEIFWKGFTKEDDFKLLYKPQESTGLYKETITNNIYYDYTYPQGYMFNIQLDNLEPSSSYSLEIWIGDIKLYENDFHTKSVSEKIQTPEPISGKSFAFDWVKLEDENGTYIVQTDYNGNWVIDGQLIAQEYDTEVYSSTFENELSSINSLIKTAYAAQPANCDTITYSDIPSGTKSKASSFENLLKLNGGSGGNPQYLRCYQDAYCEAEKVGVNGRWTLANWAHESNASDYEYPAGSLYEDFGVHCCGVSKKNFQAQLGFFLSLTHNPCNLGSSASKKEYYCCWANDYLNGNKSTQCSDQTTAYLNSLMAYYYWVSNSADPGNFEKRLEGLPARIKTNAKNVTCGSTDPIEVYENGGEIPEDPQEDKEGICCGLKITGKDQFRGDYEDNDTQNCNQIWKEGREVYGGKIQYSENLNIDNRASCEKWWEGVCCNVNGENKWVAERNCKNEIDQYTTYNSCINGESPDVEVCCKDTALYEWKYKRKCSNVVDQYDSEYNCLKANGREVTLSLDLQKGYNFVAWNASDPTNPMLASQLFENSPVILIASFENGSWNKIIYRDQGEIKGSDFNLLRGKAYLITTTSDVELQYSGRTFTEFSWGGMKGWQFVPAQALDPYSNTKSVVLSFDTVDVTQVGLWNKEVGKFDYYVYDIAGNEYGESVRLNENQGVFVKID